jgi:DNA-binding MarR family transcriptional regulator
MDRNGKKTEDLGRSSRPIGFLLSQVGSIAASKFAELLKPLGISPSHAGILRALAKAVGLSQKDLCTMLSILPSRLVILIDELESKGLVQRADDPADRRSYSLRLTNKGLKTMSSIGDLARLHSEEMCKGLSSDQRGQLGELLSKIAETQGLTPGVHPGYKRIGKRVQS